jgi:dipeptidyl aminopeptidase/acylaminoacyl peptidase
MRLSHVLLTGIAATALALPAAAQTKTAFSLDDLAKINQVGAVTIQGDGARIAYTLSVPRDVMGGEKNGTTKSKLYVTSGPGAEQVFSDAEGGFGNLGFTASGDLVFTARRGSDEASAVYTLPATGGEARKLFAFESSISDFELSPDGKTIWFVASEKADPKIKAAREKGFNANVYEENLTFSHVWKAGLGADAKPVKMAVKGHVSDITLSPDGQLLAVHTAPTPLVDHSLMEVDIQIVDAGTGTLRATVNPEGKIGSAKFSPGSDALGFFTSVDRADPVAQTLAVANITTGSFSIIDRSAEQHVLDFDWLDNDTLVALAHQGTASALISYGKDGTKINETDHEGIVAGSFERSANGRIAMVADSPAHPRELFVADGDGAPAQWTDHNSWLKERELHKQEVIRYAARDGVEVEGILITPNGKAPKGGWPAIAVVHGGPEAHDHNGWMTNYGDFGQIGAAEGFVLFFPNYRGSTGRGEAFAKLDHADAPGDEFWDIVDGINHLAEKGLINKAKVGITGGSYGGFASSWGATIATEHFAASAPFVALTNLISFSGTTDIPVEMVDVHFMKHPWEDWQMYLEKSPTTHAHKSRTPTLILHGEADPRVHPAQSTELYRYLKQASAAPVRLVTYPGEGHGNRMAAAQYDYATRVLRWMKHYLQGPGGEPPAADWGVAEKLGK